MKLHLIRSYAFFKSIFKIMNFFSFVHLIKTMNSFLQNKNIISITSAWNKNTLIVRNNIRVARPAKGRCKQLSRVELPIYKGLQILIMWY
jgi:hypothetical protein